MPRLFLTVAVAFLAIAGVAHGASWRLLPPLAESGWNDPVAAFGPGGGARIAWLSLHPDPVLMSRRLTREGTFGSTIASPYADNLTELSADRDGNWFIAGFNTSGDDRSSEEIPIGGFARPNGAFSLRRLAPDDVSSAPPDLAVSSNGRTAAFVFRGLGDQTTITQGRRSDALANPRRVPGAYSHEAVVALDIKGRAHVLWVSGGSPEDLRLRYARELSSGRFSHPVAISRAKPNRVVEIPDFRLGIDRSGRLVATYHACGFADSRTCRIEATLKPVGKPWTRARVLGSSALTERFSFSMVPAGHAVAAWARCDSYPRCSIFAATLRPRRSHFERAKFLGNHRPFGTPLTAIGARGHAATAWNDAGRRIEAAFRRLRDGFGKPVQIAPTRDQGEPSVSVDKHGRALVAFMQRSTEYDTEATVRVALRE